MIESKRSHGVILIAGISGWVSCLKFVWISPAIFRESLSPELIFEVTARGFYLGMVILGLVACWRMIEKKKSKTVGPLTVAVLLYMALRFLFDFQLYMILGKVLLNNALLSTMRAMWSASRVDALATLYFAVLLPIGFIGLLVFAWREFGPKKE